MLARESGSALRVLKTFSKHNKSWQMALAISLGLVAGLVPKTNLLALLIYASIAIFPVHTLLAIGVSLLVSCFAIQFDPLTHRLGMWLLEHPKAEGFWMRLESVPLVPWFNLHNSVVLGSFVAGLILVYPIFVLGYLALKWIDTADERSVAAQRRKFELLAPMSAQPVPLISSRIPSIQKQAKILPASRWHAGNPVLNRAVVTQAASARSLATLEIDSSKPQRASDVAGKPLTAEKVDNIVAQLTDCTLKHEDADLEAALERDDSDEQWLIETTIEIVRLAEEAVAKKRNEDEPTDRNLGQIMTQRPRDPSASTHSSISPATESRRLELSAPKSISVGTSKSRSDIADAAALRIPSPMLNDATRSSRNAASSSSPHTKFDLRNSLAENREASDNREEALRYLLRHLREIKERV